MSGRHYADPTGAKAFRLDPEARRIFAGLMLGMFTASAAQTIVGPAMPRIVAELGGMEYYSWVATAAMLVSAVSVPIIGKLSDLYGRRPFYLAGLIAFMMGALVCGLATEFWILVVGRALQGFGMGTLFPLSQTIIGDIVPPRYRGKYQGLMGSTFGFTSIAGPIAGGVITDHFGWRWLFFLALPISLLTTILIAKFLKLPHVHRKAVVDKKGAFTLAVALTAVLVATSFGGITYPWASPQIIGLYAVFAVFLFAFIRVQRRAVEPILPLRLFRSQVFTIAVLSCFGTAIVMFSAIIYIPVFAQGVMGLSATMSGIVLTPMMFGMVTLSIISGFVVAATGHYKPVIVTGILFLITGVSILCTLDYTSSIPHLVIGMIAMGVGLGMSNQIFVLAAQNATPQRDLGVVTATAQFFRNVGSTVGVAVYGTVIASGLSLTIARYLPAEASGGALPDNIGAGDILDPALMQGLSDEVVTAVRHGLSDHMQASFLIGLPVLVLVLLGALFMKPVALRETNEDPEPDPPAASETASGEQPVAAPVPDPGAPGSVPPAPPPPAWHPSVATQRPR